MSLGNSIFSFGPEFSPQGQGARAGRFALCMDEIKDGERHIMHQGVLPDCYISSAATILQNQGAIFVLGVRSFVHASVNEVIFKDPRQERWIYRESAPRKFAFHNPKSKICATDRSVFILDRSQLACYDIAANNWRTEPMISLNEDPNNEEVVAWL